MMLGWEVSTVICSETVERKRILLSHDHQGCMFQATHVKVEAADPEKRWQG